MLGTHEYRITTTWHGNTADGPRHYSRTHDTTTTPPTTPLKVTADKPFRGEPGIHNPEQLLVMAASSCHMMSFLYCASQAGFDIRHYVDEAHALMPMRATNTAITAITLHPTVTIANYTSSQQNQLDALMDQAHDECFIANTLSCPITHQPTYIPAN